MNSFARHLLFIVILTTYAAASFFLGASAAYVSLVLIIREAITSSWLNLAMGISYCLFVIVLAVGVLTPLFVKATRRIYSGS